MRTGSALGASLLAFVSLAAGGESPALAPFVADYAVSYGSMSVGTSHTELKRGDGPGRWIFESRADAQGLARLVAGGRLVQTQKRKV